MPFVQLAPEHRFFNGLAAQAAIVNFRPYLAAMQLVVGAVIVRRVWDEYKFMPANALHFFQDLIYAQTAIAVGICDARVGFSFRSTTANDYAVF